MEQKGKIDDIFPKIIAKYKKLEGPFCLPKKIKIIFPKDCKFADLEDLVRGRPRRAECTAVISELEKLILKTFGGFTRYEATGMYLDWDLKDKFDTLPTIIDNNYVYEVGRECFEEGEEGKLISFIESLKDLAKKAGQNSVAVSPDGTEFVFFE